MNPKLQNMICEKKVISMNIHVLPGKVSIIGIVRFEKLSQPAKNIKKK